MVQTSPLVADRYRLVAELGRGGMGVVWEAFDEVLHRAVAVKEVRFPPELPEQERQQLAGRTLREARAVAAVDTPAAVRVYDIVEQDGRPWLVMELLRGTTLSEEITRRGPLPEPEVARIGLALVEALDAAHAAGVLHRDVKPSNVLLGEDGRVALTDFGIATIEGDSGDATTGVVLGSPSYVAPERAAGDRPTAASDHWALGATLWTALEGRPPYVGPTAFAVLTAVAGHDAPRCARCSAPLADLLTGLLSRDPTRRPSPEAVRAVLEQSASRPVEEAAPTVALPLDAHFDRTTVLDPPRTPAPPSPVPSSRATRSPLLPPRVLPAAPPEPGRRRSPALLVALALLVVVGAGATGLLLASGGGGAGGHGGTAAPAASASASSPATTPAGSDGTSTAPSTAPSTGASPDTSSASSSAAGLTPVTGDGWRLAVPDGWTRSTTDAGTRWSDPAGGRYLLLATRDPAGPSAVGAWRDQERSFRGSHADYRRLRLETVDDARASDAADWEFLYADGGAQLHALDRAWVVHGVGYAVFVQSRADDWSSSQALFQQVLSSFRADD